MEEIFWGLFEGLFFSHWVDVFGSLVVCAVVHVLKTLLWFLINSLPGAASIAMLITSKLLLKRWVSVVSARGQSNV